MASLFEQTLEKIVENDQLHAKLLNTLSLMENVGARKISKYEHPVHVSLTVLKHAAEESRHAFYLKKQIGKLGEDLCPDYAFEYLIAPIQSYQYLHQLDVQTCRYLYNKGLKGRAMQDAAYILVTYAIEVRADSLYDIYQSILTKSGSKVNVKSIILEEAGHLEEMTRLLKDFDPNWEPIANDICRLEASLHALWIEGLAQSLQSADQ